MNDNLLYEAVRKALNVPVDITVHSILRYVERNFKDGVEKARQDCAIRWKFLQHGLKVTDDQFFKYLCKFHVEKIELAKADLSYYIKGKYDEFVADDMKFVIRNGKLITVYEV